MTEQGERTLSDADVEAIARALESRLTDRIVKGAGTGALAFTKKLIVWAIIGLFAYAVAHGFRQ
jgi:hypothetical protein